jgi:hypothetical protein
MKNILFSLICASYALIVTAGGSGVMNQKSHYTLYDRYPAAYSLVSELKNGGVNALKILSFGCSFGLEAKTLIEKYFPNSVIFGADIDDTMIASARFENINYTKNTQFFNVKSVNLSNFGSYDVIFANSVLIRHPTPANIMAEYPFDLYNSTISDLDSVLRIGGILVSVNTNYFFRDTLVSRKYQVVDYTQSAHHVECSSVPNVHMFRPNSNEFVTIESPKHCIFQKMSG